MSVLDENIIENTDIGRIGIPDVNELKYYSCGFNRLKDNRLNLTWSNKYTFEPLGIETINFQISPLHSTNKEEEVIFNVLMHITTSLKVEYCDKWSSNTDMTTAYKTTTFVIDKHYKKFEEVRNIIKDLIDKISYNPNSVLSIIIKYNNDVDDIHSNLVYIGYSKLMRELKEKN